MLLCYVDSMPANQEKPVLQTSKLGHIILSFLAKQLCSSLPSRASNSSSRRVINPTLKLQESLLIILLLLLVDSARLEDFAESRVEVGQQCDQHEAGGYVLWVEVHDAVEVGEVRGRDGGAVGCDGERDGDGGHACFLVGGAGEVR